MVEINDCGHKNWEAACTKLRSNYYTGRPEKYQTSSPYHVWCKDCEKFINLITNEELLDNDTYEYHRISDILRVPEDKKAKEDEWTAAEYSGPLLTEIVVIYKTSNENVYQDHYKASNPKEQLLYFENDYLNILAYNILEKEIGRVAMYDKGQVIKVGAGCGTTKLK